MSNIKEYAYKSKIQLTKNINVSELRCKGSKHTHNTKIDLEHVNKIQDFMNTYGYTKVYFSSGYRCESHNKTIGGASSSQHTLGTGTDQCFYKDGKPVSSKTICCQAQDFGFKGVALIDDYYVHLDSRANGIYRGDERKGYDNNVGNDFYSYFGIENPNKKKNQVEVNGVWDLATTKKAQEVFGTPVDGKVSNQYSTYKSKNKGLSSETFEWKSKPNKGGSQLIKAIQKKVGITPDGYIGTGTIKAMQKWLGTTQDGCVSNPSSMVKAFQKWLNKQ